MTVFIEYVLIDNFFIDYMLLKLTLKMVGKKYNRFRLALCAFLGAFIALVYPLIQIKIISISVKVLSGFLLTLLAINYNTKKEYAVITSLFFAFTFAVGGGIMGIYALFNLNYSSEISIALMCLPVYILSCGVKEVVSYIYQKKGVMQSVYKVQLRANGVSLMLNGFMDTGNGVYFENSPVIFISIKLAKKFFQGNSPPKIVKVGVNTINGEAKKVGVKLEEVKLYDGENERIIEGVVACAINKGLEAGVDAILHPALIGGFDAVKVNRKTQKVG